MKVLKTEEYVQRLASLKETNILCDELERLVTDGPGLYSRTVCDRVLRACNQKLSSGVADGQCRQRLVALVELAVQGYELGGPPGARSSPLYLEKIVFHILQKLANQRAFGLANRLGQLLHNKLQHSSAETEDFRLLVRNCFAVLWNSLLSQAPSSDPKGRLSWQLGALSFRLLEEGSASSPSLSKTPLFVEEALTEFERAGGAALTEDDSDFLISELRSRLFVCLTIRRGTGSAPVACSSAAVVSEIVLKVCRLLCKAHFWSKACELVEGLQEKFAGLGSGSSPALVLCDRAVKLHRSLSSGEECGQVFTDCARLLRSLSEPMGDFERHAVLEACQLVVWATEAGQSKGMGGATLLAWFSFLEEHQELLLKTQKDLFSQQQQYSLCFSLYQGFISAHNSLQHAEVRVGQYMDRVVLYCQSTVGRLMNELRRLNNENFLLKSVSGVNSVVYEFFNRKLYSQALSLAEVMCQELCRDCPVSLPLDRVNRCFMLVVQCSRRSGEFEKALDWVVRWIQVLGVRVLDHLTEPVSLWVRTKADAARAGDDDTRLRTLRDGMGPCAEEEVLLRLLEEELRVYKEQACDTAQERYNTLCDLLELCPEHTTHTLRRAAYLWEMAQVVCYQDFSQQTDCSAVDFAHEALRLLEAEPETEENADRLKDERAHASLWLYICTLEANLQEALQTEQRLRAVQEQNKGVNLEPVPTNDLEYENKHTQRDSQLVYEGLCFNLTAHNKLCEPLDRSLSVWAALLKRGDVPAVRNPKQTSSSLSLMASLYSLMGKPLQALEGYQLSVGVSRCLGDAQSSANTLCLSARLLLELGCPELAQVHLEQAEHCLTSNPGSEGVSVISMTTKLLRAQICLSMGEVERGVESLCDVLTVSAERHSKSWYLLRARALQTGSDFLHLDTHTLSTELRQRITRHGLMTPDTAQYEGLKLLCSLVMMLLGNGFYGAPGPNTDTRFVDQGDSVLFKCVLLREVLVCSARLVCVRSSSGAVHEAKVQCVEALKLATKLHTLSHCVELLVLKAELEYLKGNTDASTLDLEQVTDLLELDTDFCVQRQRKTQMKIKPRKGRPADVPALSGGGAKDEEEEELSDILSSRSLGREPVEGVAEQVEHASSPPLKPKRRRWLACLTHGDRCACPCCTEPALARVSVLWALTQAQLAPDYARRLRHLALQRCQAVTATLCARLASVMSLKERPPVPRLLRTEVGRVYVGLAQAVLETGSEEKAGLGVWELLRAGLEAVSPERGLCGSLGPVRAALLVAEALACCFALSAKRCCRLEDLFSDAWAWNKPASGNQTRLKSKLEPRDKDPSSSTKVPQHAKKDSSTVTEQDCRKTKNLSSKKPRDSSKKSRDSVAKVAVTLPGSKPTVIFKTPRATSAPQPKPVAIATGGRNLSAFDFLSDGQDIPMPFTPAQKTSARRGAPGSKVAPKGAFQVFEELSPTQEKVMNVPAAPKRTKRSRFKVEFSDESDSEARAPSAVTEENYTCATPKPNPPQPHVTPTTQPTRRTGRGKRSTALPSVSGQSSGEEGGVVCQQPRPRRGRSRKAQSSDALEEPERMRMIREDEDEGGLDTSLEQLTESVSETQEADAPEADFEVLRRDMRADLGLSCINELKREGSVGGALQSSLHQPNTGPADLSLEAVQSSLRSAWLLLHHFPPPSLYPRLCSLLSQSLGHMDPVTTAMLHVQSLGVSTRHHVTRHLASRLRKLRKADVLEGLSALSLEESSAQSQSGELQKLSALENIYAFTAAAEMRTHTLQFTQQLNNLPTGVTVCLLSVLELYPGEIGETLLLTRLERDSAPITVRISTPHQQPSVVTLLDELNEVMREQREVSGVVEKVQWWEGRKALDVRMQRLLEQMEETLGVWRTLLLPLTSDPELEVQLKGLQPTLTKTRLTQDMLKVVLSASPLLSLSDLQSLVEGACLGADFLSLLQGGVSALKGREEPQGHTVLILDKYLQRLPWENICCLKHRSVTRMPSLQAVLGHTHLQQVDGGGVLSRGVDPQQVYYVLNPDNNLPDTQQRFQDWFTSEQAWQGVCGTAPDPDKLQEAVTTKDLYIYVGHGAGARFLDAQRVLKGGVRAAALLFGCSSAALSVQGELEGTGIVLSYLTAGCPLVLGNLWDVTDRDIDRFTAALLRSWLSAPSGSSLLQHIAQSRDSTRLRHMIGAAPIAYGLPVYLR
ncbi:separin [Chanos chanos]|uniref:separase n=1 Tax=Chanos chanos TaxID=29144 RepID=A0A6J2VNG1_CHACN|nr:separin [Chanos chanos]